MRTCSTYELSAIQTSTNAEEGSLIQEMSADVVLSVEEMPLTTEFVVHYTIKVHMYYDI